MTPKEKAKELVEKLQQFSYCADGVNSMERQYQREDNAKQCALIAVDEIINSSPSLPIIGDGGTFGEDIELSKSYWQEVKIQIQNL